MAIPKELQKGLTECLTILEVTNKIDHRALFLERLRNSNKPTDAVILKFEEDQNMKYISSDWYKHIRVYRNLTNGDEIEVADGF